MKPIEEFTQEVVDKSKRGKRRKRIWKTAIVLTVVFSFVFAIVYSNIIPFHELFRSRTYERYMQSYATADRETSLKILDYDNAALTVGSRAYPCALEQKNSKTFALSVLSAGEKTDELTVEFSNGKAELTGALSGEKIGETLNVVEDMQVESGVWTMFGRENREGEITKSTLSWFLIGEKESFFGEGTTAWGCEFVAVGNRVLQYTRDQVSGFSEVSLVEFLSAEKFGFPVIRNTLYESDADEYGFISYYKKQTAEDAFAFSGGKFETELVTYKNRAQRVNPDDMYYHSGVGWRLRPIYSVDETRAEVKLTLVLSSDGTLSFRSQGDWRLRMRCEGRWYALKSSILVVLDEDFAGLKAFTIFRGESAYAEWDFSQSAISSIDVVDVYKVGYHTFDYYVADANIKVYWGSGWTEETLLPKLRYGVFYEFEGWITDWHEVEKEGERIPLVQTKTTSLVFRENGKYEVYRDGEYLYTASYELDEYEKNRFTVKPDRRVTVYCEDGEYSARYFNVASDRIFFSMSEHTTTDEGEIVRERYLSFRIKG